MLQGYVGVLLESDKTMRNTRNCTLPPTIVEKYEKMYGVSPITRFHEIVA